MGTIVNHAVDLLKSWNWVYAALLLQSVFAEVFEENTKAGHCNVFIMQEYLAEFQFCKVILHLLSDAGASNDVF